MGTTGLIESGMTLVVHIELFNTQDLISNSPYCLPYTSCDVSLENLVLDQLIISLIKIFLYSHNLSAWYCTDIARRNSVLVTHGS